MKGDFSRLTGLKAKRKHYSAVLKQQGRVQLDSDWNELTSIISHQRKTRTIDIIGQCGAPIHNSGFQILHPGNGMQDLLFSTGRFYAGGWLCETSPSAKLPINGFGTGDLIFVDDTAIDGLPFVAPQSGEPDQWVQIITDEHPDGIIGRITQVGDGELQIDSDISSLLGDQHPYLRRLLLYSQQADFPTAPDYTPVVGQTDLLYLDVWERHITSVEDPDLREVALGGPDTDTRSKIVAQVKVVANVGNVGCEDEIDAWNDTINIPNGRLTTRLTDPPDPIDPCQLGESGGFLGLENHLYRVEIHDIDTAGVASFKWSRDNAAFAYGIKEFFDGTGTSVTKISLKQNGKDDILKIKQQDWIEVSGDETDLDTETAGTLAQVSMPVEGAILTLNEDVSAHLNESFPKVRRWDTSNQRPNVTTAIVPGTPYQLEDGIEIEFSGTEFKVGNYWVFSARVLTGEIEKLSKEPPLGIKHHYCKLALVTGETGGEVDIEDCRSEFPPLTELPDKGGCCTVTVGADAAYQDIQLAIDSLKGGPGEVCIKPGVYIIEKPILVQGNDITIRGCEGTPIIINTARESNGKVFEIRSSWDIHIHDLGCLSLDGIVIAVENTLFFNLHNCFLVGGGNRDNNGIISLLGLTVDARMNDNLILGMVGIRYDQALKQSLNFHLNTRAEKNIIFALDHGLVQNQEVTILGFDLKENLILGIGLDLLSKSFFPSSLFDAAAEANLYDNAAMQKAKADRSTGIRYESINRKNVDIVHSLSSLLKLSSAQSRSFAGTLSNDQASLAKPIVQKSRNPLLAFTGTLVDANLTDNILIGDTAVLAVQAFECTINSNIIWAQQTGVELGAFEGITIENNFIVSNGHAIGCFGAFLISFTVSNNRLLSQHDGIVITGKGVAKSQYVINLQIDKNIITALNVGINFEGSSSLLWDFTAVDNSILYCNRAGIMLYAQGGETQASLENMLSFQRVIQRNSITIAGVGIATNLPGCKVLDNDISIVATPNKAVNLTRGIVLASREAAVGNNTIQAVVDFTTNRLSSGGIYLELDLDVLEEDQQQIHIHNNRILGGLYNGIEIASNITGLVIEENQIADMGLNGVAVQSKVQYVNDLRINRNHIQHCHKLMESKAATWWRYAGIILTHTEKAQIIGNVICDNGRTILEPVTHVNISAFYALRIKETTIANNQFVNNGVPDVPGRQAVIHVPIVNYPNFPPAEELNEDVQINNNLVKGSLAPALILGNYAIFSIFGIIFRFAVDSKAVITANHFEATRVGPLVDLQISQCIFGNNYVSCDTSTSAVSLGYGWTVMANGNVTSDAITGVGFNQTIVNNIQF